MRSYSSCSQEKDDSWVLLTLFSTREHAQPNCPFLPEGVLSGHRCVDSSDKGRVVAPCLKARLDYTVLTSKDSSRRTRECASPDGGGLVAKSCDSCNPIACQAPLPWDSPGKNTGMGYHFLLQGIFLSQGWNLHLPCLLLCRPTLHS